MKKILITNDDGVKSQGIAILIEMLKGFGDITVVAPFEPQSGMSVAITIGKPIRLVKLRSEEGVTVYGCNGTPADCVKIAMNKIFNKKAPDFLFSGINHGSNASVASLYSGTLGAAAEGTLYGIPSIGFSLTSHSSDANFEGTIYYGKKIAENFITHPPKESIYLNANFPPLSKEEIKGVKFAKQGNGRWINEFEEREDPYGHPYYWLTGEFLNSESEELSADHNLIANNYISIVPHKIDNTDYLEMERLDSLWEL